MGRTWNDQGHAWVPLALQWRRKAHGLTLNGLAQKIEEVTGRRFSTATVTHWEEEKPYLAPPANIVTALGKILECDTDDFYFHPKVVRDELRPGNRRPHRYKSDSPGDRLVARLRSDQWRKPGGPDELHRNGGSSSMPVPIDRRGDERGADADDERRLSRN